MVSNSFEKQPTLRDFTRTQIIFFLQGQGQLFSEFNSFVFSNCCLKLFKTIKYTPAIKALYLTIEILDPITYDIKVICLSFKISLTTSHFEFCILGKLYLGP